MIDTLIITVIIIFFTISIWLYDSSKRINAELDINTSLTPIPSIESNYRPLTKLTKLIELMTEIIPGVISLYKTRSELEPSGWEWQDTPRIMKFYGMAQIPQRVYQGDSFNIILTLIPSTRYPVRIEKSVEQTRKGDKVNLNLMIPTKGVDFLEVEIMAAGFSIDGEKKQKQPLIANELKFQWNCFFEKSGIHTFSFIFKTVDSSGETNQFGLIEQSIRVAQVDHLTQRQVWLLATSAGILSGVLTLAELLKKLVIW